MEQILTGYPGPSLLQQIAELENTAPEGGVPQNVVFSLSIGHSNRGRSGGTSQRNPDEEGFHDARTLLGSLSDAVERSKYQLEDSRRVR